MTDLNLKEWVRTMSGRTFPHRRAEIVAAIEQLEAEAEHWKCEDANGVALIQCQAAWIEGLEAANAELRKQVRALLTQREGHA